VGGKMIANCSLHLTTYQNI